MYGSVKAQLRAELDEIEAAGLKARARHPRPAVLGDRGRRPRGAELLREQLPRARERPAHRRRGAPRPRRVGLRARERAFICGTQELHLELERRVSEFLGYDDTILFSSCFDANGGVFEVLFGRMTRSSPTS